MHLGQVFIFWVMDVVGASLLNITLKDANSVSYTVWGYPATNATKPISCNPAQGVKL